MGGRNHAAENVAAAILRLRGAFERETERTLFAGRQIEAIGRDVVVQLAGRRIENQHAAARAVIETLIGNVRAAGGSHVIRFAAAGRCSPRTSNRSAKSLSKVSEMLNASRASP